MMRSAQRSARIHALQVALLVCQDEEQFTFAGDVAIEHGFATPFPRTGRNTTQLGREDQSVARTDLSTEAPTIEPAEERKLAGKTRVGQYSDGTHLGDRLTHQDPREGRATRKVPREEPLIAGQRPQPGCGMAGLKRSQRIDE